jgi:hypothetical protein
MAERPKKLPRDPVQLAKLIGDIATGEIDDREQDSRNPAAVELAVKKGGAGGPLIARMSSANCKGRKRWSK